jgi:hypothetical protein
MEAALGFGLTFHDSWLAAQRRCVERSVARSEERVSTIWRGVPNRPAGGDGGPPGERGGTGTDTLGRWESGDAAVGGGIVGGGRLGSTLYFP